MNTEPLSSSKPRPSLLRNWLSLFGLIIVAGGLFSFTLLALVDSMSRSANPYIGILTYVVAPVFLLMGLAVTVVGAWRERRKLGQSAGLLPAIVVDLTRPRDRRILGYFVACSLFFLLLSAIGSYHTYNLTESVSFCGRACHTVMKPELTAYEHGPHARVSCVECHIGKGATWFVRSKLSGTYQLYATAFDKYPRPIPTPIQNLRPAQETCEQCHWPSKFVGNLQRTYNFFQGDATNSPYTLSLLIKVGGGDPTHGPTGGIHWHMNVGNKVEYVATDPGRQDIPWVRITDQQGVVTVYHTKTYTNTPAASDVRLMDCMDCHNRPAHKFMSPDDAVDLAMSLPHEIDPQLPWIKTNAVDVLTQPYTNTTQAVEFIATALSNRYPQARNDEKFKETITAVQQIYRDNFFPEMKADWRAYPDNIGHKDWPGCFRCHDGNHVTDDGKRTIKASDCNACHVILAQGTGPDLLKMTPAGQEFKHPGGDYDHTCNECHNGAL